MTNSITNSINSRLRITGLSSGLDVDGLVEKMMSTENAKLDKLKQSRDTAVWKTEAYRDITSLIKGFYTEYFDTISAKNLKSSNNFSSYAVSFKNTSASDLVSIIAGDKAKAGDFSVNTAIMAKAATLSGGNVSAKIDGSALTDADVANISAANGNNTFIISLNGMARPITLKDGLTSVAELRTELETKIKDTFGDNKINVTINSSNGISFSTVRESDSVELMSMNNGTIEAIGFENSNTSSKVNLKSKIADIKNSFATPFTPGDISGEDIIFSINGKYFRYNSSNTSIDDIMKEINQDATLNATMSYDYTSNSFKLASKQTGNTQSVEVKDVSGNLMNVLGITGQAKGSDAKVNMTINGQSVDIERPDNVFVYDGMTIDIKKDFDQPQDFKVTTDTSKTLEFIKGFVSKYNEIVDKLSTELTEKKYRDYTPLTDAQRESMSEEQIKQWEEKAKSGILRSDGIVSSILSSMRSALYSSVEGTGLTLYSMGITTSNVYQDNGKLIINEDKLKTKLAEDPTGVKELFTNFSDISYYESIDDTQKKSQRYNESGLAQRLSDIIQNAIRTSTDSNGNKGSLLMKAGMVGDRSEFDSLLFDEISDYEDRITDFMNKLYDKQEAYYNKFTALESALSKMSAQSSWLTSQLGGNS